MHAALPRTAASVLAGLTFTSSVLASLAGSCSPYQPEPESKPVALFLFDHKGLGSTLVDKKDQAFKNALGMLPARLRELPQEFPEMREIPMPAVELLLAAVSQPGRLGLTFDPGAQDQGFMGFGLVASLGPCEQKQAFDMHGRIGSLLAMAHMDEESKPSDKIKGMSEIQAPTGGVICYGPRQTDDGWRYELHAGLVETPESVFAPLSKISMPGAKGGFTPVSTARIDFRALNQAAEGFMPLIEGSGPEAEEGIDMLESMGILGENAMRIVAQSGHTDSEQVGYFVVEGMRPHAKALGVSTSPLTDAHLAMIPADASFAGVWQLDYSNVIELATKQMAAEPEAAEGLQQFEGLTGVDLIEDVVKSFGTTFGLYMSESTGGSIASAVFFVSLSDRPKFEEAHSKLVSFANSMLAAHEDVRGHIRVRAWSDADVTFHSLTFPGLPVPLEVSYALVDNWLVGGLTPQSALTAARQIKGKGDKGLGSNAGFAGAFPSGRSGKNITSFTFLDTPRLMRDGYQYVSFLGSAVSNMVRSATDEAREPGLVVPTYADLKAGAKPLVSFSYWKDDDYIMESHADRSMLVNLSGVMGAAAPFLPLIGALAAAAGEQMQNEMEPVEEMFDNLLLP